jgi:hypothetical protein
VNVNLYDDCMQLIDTLDFPETTKVSTGYIKQCIPLMMTAKQLKWMDRFFGEGDTDNDVEIVAPCSNAETAEALKKPKNWVRCEKTNNEGIFDDFDDKCIIRTYVQRAVEEDNLRWEFISSPDDTKLLAIILVQD